MKNENRYTKNQFCFTNSHFPRAGNVYLVMSLRDLKGVSRSFLAGIANLFSTERSQGWSKRFQVSSKVRVACDRAQKNIHEVENLVF